MKVLIVEDDFTSRMILQRFLSPYGVCDVVMDGNEALQAYQMAWEEKKPYDLICMDIMMPNMNGHEAITKIRELESALGGKYVKKTVIIMTTSRDDTNDVKDAIERGANWYLLKPVNKQHLLNKLRELALI
jgi:two-component system, chemotaxis family, chemotaxis protein CheY